MHGGTRYALAHRFNARTHTAHARASAGTCSTRTLTTTQSTSRKINHHQHTLRTQPPTHPLTPAAAAPSSATSAGQLLPYHDLSPHRSLTKPFLHLALSLSSTVSGRRLLSSLAAGIDEVFAPTFAAATRIVAETSPSQRLPIEPQHDQFLAVHWQQQAEQD